FLITGFGEPFSECGYLLCSRSGRASVENSYHWHRRLLRARRERAHCRATEQRDELAALHSITSSARNTKWAGISCPIAFAALRLMTSWNGSGCSTGMLAGLAPRRTFPTIRAR